MNDKLNRILNGHIENMILPFLWMHGEPESVIRDTIAQIDAAGVGALCVESRPHPDFAGETWWSDMEIVLDECEKRSMKVWILDDSHFPTGYANGTVPPECRKWMLHEDHIDVIGPNPGAAILLPGGMPWRVLAAKRTGHMEAVDGAAIDITASLHDGLLYWDIPEGVWRIFFLTVDQSTHQDSDYARKLDRYLDPLTDAGTQTLIDAVYEPHYQHFGDRFGKTIMGFFSDEPQIGVSASYDAIYGKKQFLPAVWGDHVRTALAERLGADTDLLLPGLWYDIGSRTAEVRHAYMDVVTRLYKEHFCDKLGDWCRAHGVEYIGHVIEDNNCHTRIGHGTGHYFRALWGQDMAGMDIVLHQVVPGLRTSCHTWTPRGQEADDDFFYYVLGQMTASLAQIDPKKKGRAMVENFGAYGWGSGLRQMKWLADFTLVRGINRYVPHAYTLKEFPDPDCPPHFHAGGHDPQYRHFHRLMAYVNRISNLIDGGMHCAEAAVLYHAEAEWTGKCMLVQQPMRVLCENQIGCSILPADVLLDGTAQVEDGLLTLNGHHYRVLVIPQTEYVTPELAQWICRASADGLTVCFTDEMPSHCTKGDLPSELAESADCIPLEALADYARGAGCGDITLTPACPEVRTYHYAHNGLDCWLLFNESVSAAQRALLSIDADGPVYAYDAFANTLSQVDSVPAGDNTEIQVQIGPYEMLILLTGDVSASNAPVLPRSFAPVQSIGDTWRISTATAEEYPAFTVQPELTALRNLNAPDALPRFAGTVRYETTFTAPPADGNMYIDLGGVGEVAEVWLNGVSLGAAIAPPYRFSCGNALHEGDNTLVVEVINNLGYRERDWLSHFQALPAFGLMGPVSLMRAE